MNVLHTFDYPDPHFLNLAGFGGWFGLLWAVNARDEVPLLRLSAPFVGALVMLGINNILLVCFAILSFVIRAMFHPIPLSLGILTLSALSSIVYLKKQIRHQIHQSIDEAFQYVPPAVAAAQEVLDDSNQQGDNQVELSVSDEEEETQDEMNEAMMEEQQQEDDNTVESDAPYDDQIGDTHGMVNDQDDNQTIQSEEEDNVVMAPIAPPANLPISPPDSPIGFPAAQAPLFVVEPMPQFELIPAGGAGDVYPDSTSPNPHA